MAVKTEVLKNNIDMKNITTLAVIVPVCNEESHIDRILKQIIAVELQNVVTEIIVVNDGSTDGTLDVLKKYENCKSIKIVHHKVNMGKATAVKTGIKKASSDIVLIQDADLEYLPCFYPSLLGPIIRKETSVVYGSRFKGGIKKMTLINRLANIVSNITIKILFRTTLSDINTGFKVFKREIFKNLEIESEGFGFETEITVKLLKRGFKIKEIPITYTARTKKEGKKITWWKAIKMYGYMFKYL